MTVDKIEQWLMSNEIYNAVVEVEGRKYLISRVFGIQVAESDDLKIFPFLGPPEWLRDWIVDEWHTGGDRS